MLSHENYVQIYVQNFLKTPLKKFVHIDEMTWRNSYGYYTNLA